MRVGIAVAAAVLLSSAAACSTRPDPRAVSVGENASAVQGGAVDQTHSFAVGVCGGGKGNCQLICSGALIAPNLVVTARHCVNNISNPQVECATTTFGGLLGAPSQFWITTNYNLFQATTGWHQVAKVFTPTETSVCGNDIALLLLTGNVPASEAKPVTPAVEHPITDHTVYSTTDTAIGYGLTSPSNQNSAGLRHIKQNIQIQCIPGDKEIDCGPLAGQNIDAKEFLAGDGTCEGDSGSSAFEQQSFNASTPVSLGVLSRGGVSSNGQSCIGAVYTRLDSWKSLVVQAAREAAQKGGYAPAAWVTAAGDDPPDAGTASDTGVNTTPAPGVFGVACGSDDECESQMCRNINGGNLLCTKTCAEQSACPDGYSCAKGFCFPTVDTGLRASSGPEEKSGCVASPSAPSAAVPWGAVVFGLAGVAFCRRRRQARPQPSESLRHQS